MFLRLVLLCVIVPGVVFGLVGCEGRDRTATSPRAPTERDTTSAPTQTSPPSTSSVPGPAPCAPEERPKPIAAPPKPPPAPEPQPSTPDLPPSLVAAEWQVLPTARNVVALTFDCGANADGVPAILRTLARANAPATFFLTGRWAATFPELARKLGQRYSVGNHTNSHPDLTALSNAAVRIELRRAQRAIQTTTGRDPRPLFRFPYGARDARTIAIVNDLGYGSIRWTVDTLGWKGVRGKQTAASVRARVLSALRPGAIILMHVGSAPDGSTLDADALPSMIASIRARGFRLVDVAAFVR